MPPTQKLRSLVQCHLDKLQSIHRYAVESRDRVAKATHFDKLLLPQPLVPLAARVSPISTVHQLIGAAVPSLGDIPQPPAQCDRLRTADAPILTVSSIQKDTAARTHLMFSASGQFGLSFRLKLG